MTMASGTLLYATAAGELWRAPFNTAPTGAPTRIGGPDVDGTNWASRAMFVWD
jgi:hypothetical protein